MIRRGRRIYDDADEDDDDDGQMPNIAVRNTHTTQQMIQCHPFRCTSKSQYPNTNARHHHHQPLIINHQPPIITQGSLAKKAWGKWVAFWHYFRELNNRRLFMLYRRTKKVMVVDNNNTVQTPPFTRQQIKSSNCCRRQIKTPSLVNYLSLFLGVISTNHN